MCDNRGSVTLTWRIENIDLILNDVGQAVWSPLFVLNPLDYTSWYLKVSTLEKRNGNYISFYLRRCSCGPDSIAIDCELSSICDGGFPDVYKSWGKETFRKGNNLEICKYLTYNKIFNRMKLVGNNNTMTVTCSMRKSNMKQSEGVRYFAHTVVNRKGKPWHSEVVKVTAAKKSCEDKQCEIKEEVINQSFHQLMMAEKNEVIQQDTMNSEFVHTDITNLLKVSPAPMKSALEHTDTKKPLLQNTNSRKLLLQNTDLEPSHEDPVKSQESILVKCSQQPTNLMKSLQVHVDTKKPSLEHADLIKPLIKKTDTVKSPLVPMRTENESDVLIDPKKALDRHMALKEEDSVVEDVNWKYAVNLYHEAEKRHLVPLKQSLSTFLQSNLLVSNACEILIHADKYQDDNLKSTIIEFISAHENEVIDSNDWDRLEENSPSLAAKTLRRISLRRSKD